MCNAIAHIRLLHQLKLLRYNLQQRPAYEKICLYFNPAFRMRKFNSYSAKIKYNNQHNHIWITIYVIKSKIKLPDYGLIIL